MNIVPFLVACSLLLAAGSVALFVFSARNRDHDHADRLSLLPLEDDLPERTGTPSGPADGPTSDSSSSLEERRT